LSGCECCCTLARSMPVKSKSLKGQLLLDGGKLGGSFFHRTVVLICQHDAEGAVGLILNRPSENTLGESVIADLPDKLKNQSLFIGGPVKADALSFLHTDTFVPQANVLPNLNLGHALEGLIELGESYSTTQKVKVFAGYSGWTAGQLEDEMKRGAWITHPASIELVFDSDTNNLWQNILKTKDWEHQLLARAPEDFSWN
jgi:putative transcriptional regulator